MKILHVIGNRPQFIKLAPVLKASERDKEIKNVCLHTGQHYDYNLSKLFFDELKIPEPDYYLDVGSGSHGYQTGEMIKRIENVLTDEKPDFVLVYGDTNSTLAGALAAVKLHIKTGHVEAGLRSYDKSMPEEINRVLADHCSNLLFCPTKTAIANLKKEGHIKGVYLTGDVMVDALLHNREVAEKSNIIEKLGFKNEEYFVATIHRASNTDNKENLENIIEAFCEINEEIVFPVHPRTEKFLRKYQLYKKLKEHIDLIKPLGYLDFLKLMSHSKKILTDSGGVQKEAYILKVPCITLRENTEWIETVEDGWNILVGTNKKRIIKMMNKFKPINKQRYVFGRGDASERIIKILGGWKE
jgi:UDP-N-acetylglucosamine 2-epimerase